MYNWFQSRFLGLAPGTRSFMQSLSMVTVCFVLSKVFSSISLIIIARYLQPEILGEAKVVLLVAQILTVPMLCGLHASMMRYGSQKDNPAPEVATVVFMFAFTSGIFGLVGWLFRHQLNQWLGISEYKMAWAIGSALLVSMYTLFTSVLQGLHLFKERGIVEILMAILVLPGILVGYLFVGRHYETQLLAFAIGYGLCIPIMVWRFRHLVSFRWLFSEDTGVMLKYGIITAFGNIAFLVIFVVQPLQIQNVLGEKEVSFFSVYSIGSIAMATLATGIFYTVFFPKVAKSQNKPAVWKAVSKTWMKAILPLFLLFCIAQLLTILPLGEAYPLSWQWLFLFAGASTLITVHSTYSQIISSEGVKGTFLNMGLSFMSAGINFGLSLYLIPRYGIDGALFALIVNFSLTLLATLVIGKWLLKPEASLVTQA